MVNPEEWKLVQAGARETEVGRGKVKATDLQGSAEQGSFVEGQVLGRQLGSWGSRKESQFGGLKKALVTSARWEEEERNVKSWGPDEEGYEVIRSLLSVRSPSNSSFIHSFIHRSIIHSANKQAHI